MDNKINSSRSLLHDEENKSSKNKDHSKRKTNILIAIIAVLTFIIIVLLVVIIIFLKKRKVADISTYSYAPSESKISPDHPVDGEITAAAKINGKFNHISSPYFITFDFYDKSPTNTIILLPHFKTYQQTSECSCGVSAMISILNYYNETNLNEDEMYKRMDVKCYNETREDGSMGASTQSLVDEFHYRGYKTESSRDTSPPGEATFDKIEDFRNFAIKHLKAGHPIAMESIEFGGHWLVLIGYDDMGTESIEDDVLILMDSYDTNDHFQDGYIIRSCERWFYSWIDNGVLSKDDRTQNFVVGYR